MQYQNPENLEKRRRRYDPAALDFIGCLAFTLYPEVAGVVMSAGEQASWHWRQALQIAGQFPEKANDAWLVLAYVERLVKLGFDPPPTEFDPPPAAPEPGNGDQVVRFPGGTNSPSRRASSRGNASILPK